MPESEEQRINTLLKSERQRDLDKGLVMLYDFISKKLTSFFKKMGVLEMHHEDLVQDTVVTVYKKMRDEQFVLTSSLSTFAFGIARNLALMNLRHKARRGGFDEIKEEAVAGYDVIESLTQIEKYRNLHQLMDQLGDNCKKILSWFYFEELSMKEIAKRMNYSSTQVAKNKKSGCMRKLRSLMGK